MDTVADIAVLLMAYGGPDSLADIEPYLLDVRGGRETPAHLVEEVRARYAQVGGRSPLLGITRAQAQALAARLNADPSGPRVRAYVGMRHWSPWIRDAVAEIVADGLRQVVAVCMAPHYSRMSIGAYFKRLAEAQEALGVALDVAKVETWHAHPRFVAAVAEKVQAALGRFAAPERAQVVFTAHSLPAALTEQGDPYADQVQETARLLAARLALPDGNWRVCYQSAGASSTRWLGPAVEEVVAQLADDGHKDILVAPIGFVADHVETLYDLDIECRRLATEHGARLERMESLNASPSFVEALAAIVRQAAAVWTEQPLKG